MAEDGEKYTVKVMIVMTPTMASLVDEYWHAKRARNKSEALRTLIQIGLDVERVAVRQKS